ncbi:hypothetical protein PAAG_05744 [Paracoccidioides lutzii Pb01]|uniref:Uncharacterized protein n=1 Tax=Paracoccidioides lutzii (strain ATCC MYA-826 / Pb01) TaxID=502779 RepID=C1H4Q4_PARBA|nr:hypothetical protein PAAG_05744 [Paracoccidioides lutzii Pb01]EEH34698.2 hypothetical protein PAAG_05744 [Paracoccidioides lutzii Pb01]
MHCRVEDSSLLIFIRNQSTGRMVPDLACLSVIEPNQSCKRFLELKYELVLSNGNFCLVECSACWGNQNVLSPRRKLPPLALSKRTYKFSPRGRFESDSWPSSRVESLIASPSQTSKVRGGLSDHGPVAIECMAPTESSMYNNNLPPTPHSAKPKVWGRLNLLISYINTLDYHA